MSAVLNPWETIDPQYSQNTKVYPCCIICGDLNSVCLGPSNLLWQTLLVPEILAVGWWLASCWEHYLLSRTCPLEPASQCCMVSCCSDFHRHHPRPFEYWHSPIWDPRYHIDLYLLGGPTMFTLFPPGLCPTHLNSYSSFLLFALKSAHPVTEAAWVIHAAVKALLIAPYLSMKMRGNFTANDAILNLND